MFVIVNENNIGVTLNLSAWWHPYNLKLKEFAGSKTFT